MNIGRMAFAYLKDRWRIIAGFMLLTAIFITVGSMYHMKEALARMFYAALIASFILICLGTADFFRYMADCRKLEEAAGREGERAFCLPQAAGLRERLYQNILLQQEQENAVLLSGIDQYRRDMQDYYALWTHQIKTPIAAMKLLLSQDQTKEGFALQEELFKIEQYAGMALQYSRLLSDSSDLLLKECEIREIIRQAIRKYSILFINKGLYVELEDFTLHAVTDEKWLSFVLEQLLSNAVKYTVRGGIRISLDAGNNVVLEDTGIGIPPEDISRIFEKGFTGYNGRTDKKSTGIGLYLCSRVMKMLSHGIRAESESGRGTRMILTFDRHTVM